MKLRHTLTDPQQVKALAAPLRRRILEAFAAQPRTTKQVAELLGEPTTRLYHHVAALEKAGLIEPSEERRKRGTIERYYRPIAREFVVDRRLFAAASGEETTSELQALFADALEETLEEIRRSLALRLPGACEPDSAAMLGRMRVRGTPEQIQKVLERLRELMEELRSAESGEGEVEYGLTVAFYPVAENTNEAGTEE
jgi:DNA-binding transcriptional ArsR family regulator